jgi:hypothetical protein
MSPVHALLDQLRERLSTLRIPAVDLLVPGLPESEVRARLAGAPDNVIEWFTWCDGTERRPRQTIDEASFIPGYIFPSLNEAIEVKETPIELPEGYADWIPVLVTGGFDFYAAAWRKDEEAQVFGVLLGEPVELEYDNVEAMVQTFSAAIDSSAFFIDERGEFSMDPDGFDRVYEQVNGRPLG